MPASTMGFALNKEEAYKRDKIMEQFKKYDVMSVDKSPVYNVKGNYQ